MWIDAQQVPVASTNSWKACAVDMLRMSEARQDVSTRWDDWTRTLADAKPPHSAERPSFGGT
jgi:hypothetical protein